MSVTDGMLTPFAEGVWMDSAPVRILGMPLTATMTILRLSDGSLLIHSPIALTPERRAVIEALGPVAHLYAPNLYHHIWLGEWAAAFPSAQVHAPAGLAKKRPELRIDRVHTAPPEPALAGVIDELCIHGFRRGRLRLAAVAEPLMTQMPTTTTHQRGALVAGRPSRS